MPGSVENARVVGGSIPFSQNRVGVKTNPVANTQAKFGNAMQSLPVERMCCVLDKSQKPLAARARSSIVTGAWGLLVIS